MQFFWTAAAAKQYLKYLDDEAVHGCFEDLIRFVEEKPSRGISLRDLTESSDGWARRVRSAISHLPLHADVLIVTASIPRSEKARRYPPHPLAALIHTPAVPGGVKANHSILTMGIIGRQKDASMA